MVGPGAGSAAGGRIPYPSLSGVPQRREKRFGNGVKNLSGSDDIPKLPIKGSVNDDEKRPGKAIPQARVLGFPLARPAKDRGRPMGPPEMPVRLPRIREDGLLSPSCAFRRRM